VVEGLEGTIRGMGEVLDKKLQEMEARIAKLEARNRRVVDNERPLPVGVGLGSLLGR